MPASLTLRVLLALVAGLVCGIVLSVGAAPWLTPLVAGAETVGAPWVAGLRMTVVPLVVSLLVVSVASVADIGALGRVGGSALLVFVALLATSATVTAIVAPAVLAYLPTGGTAGQASGQAGSAAIELARGGASQLPGIGDWLVSLVPTNPIAAAAEGALLPLVVFSVLFAAAVTRLRPDQRDRVVGLVEAIRDAMLVLVRWIIALAPIGVFALMLALAARLGTSAAGALGYYVLLVSGLLAVQTLLLYPLARVAGGVPLRRFAAAALPAQAVAVSTRSSLAALPALVDGAEQALRLPAMVAGFVLPFAVSVFKFSAPMSSVVGTLFVARLYQVDLAPMQVAFVAVAAVALSFSTPGIPAGNLVVLAPVFSSLGLPLEGLGILIALDVIPDTLKTTGNVTANLAVATIVSRATSSGRLRSTS